MDMSKKQAEFFTVLILICTVTAAAILIIDYQIKGAILEESNRMRKDLERHYGQRPAAAGSNRPDSDASNDLSYPSDMVGSGTTGVEEGGSNGSRPTPYPAPAVRRTRTPRQTRPSGIPDSGK